MNDAKSAGETHRLEGEMASQYAADLVALAVLRGELTVEING